jgi:hypothetical protein
MSAPGENRELLIFILVIVCLLLLAYLFMPAGNQGFPPQD